MADHEDQTKSQNLLDLKRLFVGGLPNDVSTKDLRLFIVRFVTVRVKWVVKGVSIHCKKPGSSLRLFDIDSCSRRNR